MEETVSQTADCLENPQMYLQMSISLLFFVLLLRLISNLLISLDRSLKQQADNNVCEHKGEHKIYRNLLPVV